MNTIATGNRIIIREKKLVDARNDYQWQTDAELSRLDAVTPMNISFPSYLLAYAAELPHSDSKRRQFAIDTPDGKHIGNCVYYGIDEDKSEAELGIMIGDADYWNKGYGTDAATLLLKYIFRETYLRRIHLKTLESNVRAQQCFMKSGFKICGHTVRDGYRFMLMEIYRSDWERRERSQQTGALKENAGRQPLYREQNEPV